MFSHNIFADDIVILYTNASNPLNYVTLPSDMDHFKFGVQSCENIIIALTTVPGVTDSQAWHIHIDEYHEGTHVTKIYSTDDSGVSAYSVPVHRSSRCPTAL